MQQVTVSVNDLLTCVERNRRQHIKLYQAALAVWHRKMVDGLARYSENLLKASAKFRNAPASSDFKWPQPPGYLKPVEYTKEYDRVLAMLRMAATEKVTLSAQEFEQYVRDNWSWTGTFNQTTVSYANSRAGGGGGGMGKKAKLAARGAAHEK